ncbi:MAG: universal stress protein [Desulfopila sp.]|nr:universal stress protein [Desulfopila sp.]
MFPVRSILWPSDGSENAFKALEAAAEIAVRFSADIHALQVVHQVPTVVGAGFSPVAVKGFDVPLYEQELLRSAEEELKQTLQVKLPEEVKASAHVIVGIPSDEIVLFAQNNSIDLIVMATHGRTGISRFMLGSVAEKTIRQSTIPTLVIPVKETAND